MKTSAATAHVNSRSRLTDAGIFVKLELELVAEADGEVYLVALIMGLGTERDASARL